MLRRSVLLLPLCATASAHASPERDRAAQLEAWWEGQRRREAAERFWNGPAEQRRNLTRDQIERWERDRTRRFGRRAGWPYD